MDPLDWDSADRFIDFGIAGKGLIATGHSLGFFYLGGFVVVLFPQRGMDERPFLTFNVAALRLGPFREPSGAFDLFHRGLGGAVHWPFSF